MDDKIGCYTVTLRDGSQLYKSIEQVEIKCNQAQLMKRDNETDFDFTLRALTFAVGVPVIHYSMYEERYQQFTNVKESMWSKLMGIMLIVGAGAWLLIFVLSKLQ